MEWTTARTRPKKKTKAELRAELRAEQSDCPCGNTDPYVQLFLHNV